MKTLVSLPSVVEAEVLVSKLLSEGIDAEIPDRHTIGMGPHLTPVLGGIRVMVQDVDWDRAVQIVKENNTLEEGELPASRKLPDLSRGGRFTGRLMLFMELGGVVALLYIIVKSWLS